jgi:hypothetical protein
VYLHAVREDPRTRGLLVLGTERGVQVSRDAGATWESLNLNLPAVAVNDLVIKDDSLVLGTHGRSIWILDDLTPVRQTAPAVAAKAAHLFPVPDTTRWQYAYTPKRADSGQNPKRGATIHYWLKDKVDGEVTLEISDASGRLVRRLSSVVRPATGVSDDPKEDKERKPELTAAAGFNRAVWDLHWGGATLISNGKIDLGEADPGPMALPGPYTVKLTAGGQTETTTVRVTADPRAKATAADLQAQHDLAQRLLADITRVSSIVTELRSVREQVKARQEVLARHADGKALSAASEALVTKLDGLERQLHNPTAEVTYDILAMKGGAQLYSRLIPLFSVVTEGDGAPTQGQRQVYEQLSAELQRLDREYRAVVDTDVAALNAQVARAGIPFVALPK